MKVTITFRVSSEEPEEERKMSYEFIDTQDIDGVLVITMDDPPTRNAIGDEMAGEINQELDRLEASDSLRAVVLTGRDPSFCSGANVKRMDDANRARTVEEALPEDRKPVSYTHLTLPTIYSV